MKLLIGLCCVVSVILAFPGKFNRRESPPILTEVIPTTSSMLNKRNTIEKRMDDEQFVQWAFAAIDTDRNGHISGEEFSTFFVYVDPDHSKSKWLSIFNKFMTLIDTNENNLLEMGEFRKLDAMDIPY